MHWSKPSENRFCGRSAKAIGLSEALVERQLAWASRGHRWHTRWISWASLARQSEQFSPVFQKSDPREIADVIVQLAIAMGCCTSRIRVSTFRHDRKAKSIVSSSFFAR